MKDIVSRSGGEAKLRLRGKGSGFAERDTKVESSEPLQLCISCPDQGGYDIAKDEARLLLEKVYEQHRKWCEEQNLPDTTPPEIKMSEKFLKGEGSGGGNNRRGRSRSKNRGKRGGGGGGRERSDVGDGPIDDTPAPPGAPPPEEIKRLIHARNEARRASDYATADRIRDDLKKQNVVLCDEKGGHGSANAVTQWRYWHA